MYSLFRYKLPALWLTLTVALSGLRCDATSSDPLRVSENGRFLVRADGKPFFYLGDAAYMLFYNLTDPEIADYLKDRAAKGFTVIEAGLTRGIQQLPTVHGERTFQARKGKPKADDFSRPNEAFFLHVDRAVAVAAKLGLHVTLFPIWDKLLEDLTEDEARIYGEFLGRRYKEQPVIWSLVGDVAPRGHEAVMRSLAAGLLAGHGGTQLMTFKPRGGASSSTGFHHDPWLSFNSIQGSHAWYRPPENPRPTLIARDYARQPAKPTMDSESGFENIPEGLSRRGTRSMWAKVPVEERFKTHDVRRVAYWTVFAGGCGFTYGANGVYQFTKASLDYSQRWDPGMEWREALNLPGASQMIWLRRLLESRPFLTRVPDQTLIASPNSENEGPDHIQATRDESGSYAFVYLAFGQPVSIALEKLSGATLAATWFNPCTGASAPISTFAKSGVREFVPPSRGIDHDWVLVLDDAEKQFPAPGQP